MVVLITPLTMGKKISNTIAIVNALSCFMYIKDYYTASVNFFKPGK